MNKLATFKTRYWDFYQTLPDYKALLCCQQNEEKLPISAVFDELFGERLRVLDLCIERPGLPGWLRPYLPPGLPPASRLQTMVPICWSNPGSISSHSAYRFALADQKGTYDELIFLYITGKNNFPFQRKKLLSNAAFYANSIWLTRCFVSSSN